MPRIQVKSVNTLAEQNETRRALGLPAIVLKRITCRHCGSVSTDRVSRFLCPLCARDETVREALGHTSVGLAQTWGVV